MRVINILDISDRAELYRWYQDSHIKIREFWLRFNRSTKSCEGVIGYSEEILNAAAGLSSGER